MKVAFVLWCRDKERTVQRAAESLLAQTYSPMEIVFSDQCSKDQTAGILKNCEMGYDGPNTISLLRCPLDGRRGIIGLNDHMRWVHSVLDADLVISASADDINHPDRAAKVVEAFKSNNAAYVLTRMKFTTEGAVVHETPSPGKSGYLSFAQNVVSQMGFSCGGAWTMDLWKKYGPMRGIEAPDLILPAMAALDGGLYLVDEVLHEGINEADPYGVSTERAIQATTDDVEKKCLHETNWSQFCSSHYSLMHRINENKIILDEWTDKMFAQKLITSASQWSAARDALALEGIQPVGLRT